VLAKPAARGDAYVVQLAALADSTKADSLKGRAVLAGFPAYTDKVGTLTRVRVGPYKSRDAASAASTKLAQHGLASGQIVAQ
jgi:DedD protein